MLRHVKVLKQGRPGSVKYRAAVKALGIGQEPKGDTSRIKVNTADPKERSGVCFSFRDKSECMYGSKCRYSHDQALLSVFSVSLTNDKSDSSLMSKARDSQSAGKVANDRDFSILDSYNDYYYDVEVSNQNHHDGDCRLEIQNQNEESPARIDMLSASKRSKSSCRN